MQQIICAIDVLNKADSAGCVAVGVRQEHPESFFGPFPLQHHHSNPRVIVI